MKPSGINWKPIAYIVCSILFIGTGVILTTSLLEEPSQISTIDESLEQMMNGKTRASQDSYENIDQFYQNLGQIDNPDIKFYGQIPGGMIGFADSRIHLLLNMAQDPVIISFEGARIIEPTGLNKLNHYVNYFLGDRGAYTRVRCFEQVKYEGLWRGIDLVYKATRDGAKYEFQVAPGAAIDDIRLQVQGQDSLRVSEFAVVIQSNQAVLNDEGLLVYQQDRTVDARFKSFDTDTFGYEIGSYDISKPLVIDPLMFATFHGGSDFEIAHVSAVDQSDNIVVAGWTWSSDFPTQSGWNSTYGGNCDAFISKFDSDGVHLWSTFIGGGDTEIITGLDTDNTGDIYVTGHTYSSNFPTTAGALNETFNGYIDVIVTKLAADGASLIFSTYIGGANEDLAFDIFAHGYMDTAFPMITGSTTSPTFPRVGGMDLAPVQDRDIYVLELSLDGSTVMRTATLGGEQDDTGYKIAHDYPTQTTYIAGYSDSDDFQTTPGVLQGNRSGDIDCVLFKLNADFTELVYSTYIGGPYRERAMGLVLDANRAAYVSGYTWGGFPTTDDAYSEEYNGGGTTDLGGDGFIFKMTPDGTTLGFSTYVGGSGDERIREVLIDNAGNAIIAGTTTSVDFPTLNAYDSTHDGGNIDETDCFMAKLKYDGKELLYSTLFGGEGDDSITKGLSFNSELDIILAGNTHSSDFPTVNAYDSTYNGNADGFLVRFTGDMNYPVISSIDEYPEEITEENEVTVTATAIDNVGIDSVTLQHRTTGTWSDVPMSNNVANNWTAVIPTYAVGSTVEYRIRANDTSNNVVYSENSSYTVVAADNTGPDIVASHTPHEITELDPAVVTSTITDVSGVIEAKLSYSINNGTSWTNISMVQEGVEWTAAIPEQPVDTIVQYKVYAVDGENNWGESGLRDYIVISSVPPEDPFQTFILIGEIAGAVVGILGILEFIRRRLKRGKSDNIIKPSTDGVG